MISILIGCEESGVVRDAFQAKGHDAWSCDLLPTRKPGKHLKCDVMNAITDNDWDIIILHPPCDYLANCGNRWYGKGTLGYAKRLEAFHWTIDLWHLAKSHARKGVCLENPVGILGRQLGHKPPQYVQPWQFGHGETKRTGLWLYNLPRLIPTDVVEGRQHRIWKMAPSPTRKRDRSETYQGIANAMAAQWGNL